MSNFVIAVRAVWPFILYMIAGWGLKKSGKADDSFFEKLNQVVFFLLLPLMVFRSIYNIDAENELSPRYVLYVFFLIVAVILVSAAIIPRFVKDRKKCGVMVQGIFRGNVLLFALPLAASVYGEETGNSAGVLIALIAPLFNVCAVLVLSVFSDQRKVDAKSLLQKVVTNPIIIAAVAAYLLRLFPRLPEDFLTPFFTLGQMATPAAVMVLGGTLSLEATRANMKYIGPTLLARFVIVPALSVLCALALGFSGFEIFLSAILFATPVASSSFPMAVNMDSDGELAGEILALSTLFCVPAIVGWIVVLGSLGLM